MAVQTIAWMNPTLHKAALEAMAAGGIITWENFLAAHSPTDQAMLIDLRERNATLVLSTCLCRAMDANVITEAEAIWYADAIRTALEDQ